MFASARPDGYGGVVDRHHGLCVPPIHIRYVAGGYMRLVPPERGLRNGRSGPTMDRNGRVSNVLRARHERGMFTGMADSAKWLPVPEEVADGKEWLETYSGSLRIRDGEHKLQIALALARYAHR